MRKKQMAAYAMSLVMLWNNSCMPVQAFSDGGMTETVVEDLSEESVEQVVFEDVQESDNVTGKDPPESTLEEEYATEEIIIDEEKIPDEEIINKLIIEDELTIEEELVTGNTLEEESDAGNQAEEEFLCAPMQRASPVVETAVIYWNPVEQNLYDQEGNVVLPAGNDDYEYAGALSEPVFSLGKAAELINENPDIEKIYCMNLCDVQGQVQFSPDRVVSMEDGSAENGQEQLYEGFFFAVLPGGELRVDNLTISGRDAKIEAAGGKVFLGEHVSMEGAIYLEKPSETEASVVLADGTQNEAESGSGRYIIDFDGNTDLEQVAAAEGNQVQRLVLSETLCSAGWILVFDAEHNLTCARKPLVYEAIYLDGVNGSDENPGNSRDCPVRSFQKAKEILKECNTKYEGNSVTVIYVMNTITFPESNSEVDFTTDSVADPVYELASTGVVNPVVKRDQTCIGPMFHVKHCTAEFYFSIDGEADGTTSTAPLIEVSDGTLILGSSEEFGTAKLYDNDGDGVHITDGVLKVEKGTQIGGVSGELSGESLEISGWGIYAEGGNLEIEGGTITGKSGGVYAGENTAKICVKNAVIQTQKEGEDHPAMRIDSLEDEIVQLSESIFQGVDESGILPESSVYSLILTNNKTNLMYSYINGTVKTGRHTESVFEKCRNKIPYLISEGSLGIVDCTVGNLSISGSGAEADIHGEVDEITVLDDGFVKLEKGIVQDLNAVDSCVAICDGTVYNLEMDGEMTAEISGGVVKSVRVWDAKALLSAKGGMLNEVQLAAAETRLNTNGQAVLGKITLAGSGARIQLNGRVEQDNKIELDVQGQNRREKQVLVEGGETFDASTQLDRFVLTDADEDLFLLECGDQQDIVLRIQGIFVDISKKNVDGIHDPDRGWNPENPAQSFAEASEIFRAQREKHPNLRYIIVRNGQEETEGQAVIEGQDILDMTGISGVEIIPYDRETPVMLTVSEGAAFTMVNVYIDGSKNGAGTTDILIDVQGGALVLQNVTASGSDKAVIRISGDSANVTVDGDSRLAAGSGSGVTINGGYLMLEGMISGGTCGINASGGEVVIGGNARVSENHGDGVEISAGTLIMQENAGITENTGNGVRMTGGCFIFCGGSISGNNLNRDRAEGGGIYASGSAELYLAGQVVIEENAAIYGGGIYLTGQAAMEMQENAALEVKGNTAICGGGMYIAGDISDDEEENAAYGYRLNSQYSIMGNEAVDGAGIYYAGRKALLLEKCLLKDNHGTVDNLYKESNGGALYAAQGEICYNGADTSGCTASNGSGIYLADRETIFRHMTGVVSGTVYAGGQYMLDVSEPDVEITGGIDLQNAECPLILLGESLKMKRQLEIRAGLGFLGQIVVDGNENVPADQTHFKVNGIAVKVQEYDIAGGSSRHVFWDPQGLNGVTAKTEVNYNGSSPAEAVYTFARAMELLGEKTDDSRIVVCSTFELNDTAAKETVFDGFLDDQRNAELIRGAAFDKKTGKTKTLTGSMFSVKSGTVVFTNITLSGDFAEEAGDAQAEAALIQGGETSSDSGWNEDLCRYEEADIKISIGANTKIQNNKALNTYGGGIYTKYSYVAIRDSEINGNIAGNKGGGVCAEFASFDNGETLDAYGSFVVSGCVFEGNRCKTMKSSGGALYLANGYGTEPVTITESVFKNNQIHNGSSVQSASGCAVCVEADCGTKLVFDTCSILENGREDSDSIEGTVKFTAKTCLAEGIDELVYVSTPAEITLKDCRISDNTTRHALVCGDRCKLIIKGNTEIRNNKNGAGIIFRTMSQLEIYENSKDKTDHANLIVSGNETGICDESRYRLEIRYADIQDNEGAGIQSSNSLKTKSISVKDTKISGNHPGVSLNCKAVSTFENTEICENTGDAAIGGGGIFSSGPLKLTDCRIHNNVIYVSRETSKGGGGIWCSGNVTVCGGEIYENTVGKSEESVVCGGGIYAEGDVELSGMAVIRDNRCNVSALPDTDSQMDMEGGTDEMCSFGCGGGIFAGKVIINDAVISGNLVEKGCGGGVYAEEAMLAAGGVISGNKAIGSDAEDGNTEDEAAGLGGGLYISLEGEVKGGEITGNSAEKGGGIYASGTDTYELDISAGVIKNNISTDGTDGEKTLSSGIFNEGRRLKLAGSRVEISDGIYLGDVNYPLILTGSLHQGIDWQIALNRNPGDETAFDYEDVVVEPGSVQGYKAVENAAQYLRFVSPINEGIVFASGKTQNAEKNNAIIFRQCVFVSGRGDDEKNNGDSPAKAFRTMERALEKVRQEGRGRTVIYICGKIEITQDAEWYSENEVEICRYTGFSIGGTKAYVPYRGTMFEIAAGAVLDVGQNIVRITGQRTEEEESAPEAGIFEVYGALNLNREIVLEGNQAVNADGGAIYIHEEGEVHINACVTVKDMSADNGGAVYNEGTMTLKSGASLALENTTAAYSGNGIYQKGNFVLEGGSEISSDGTIYLTDGKYLSVKTEKDAAEELSEIIRGTLNLDIGDPCEERVYVHCETPKKEEDEEGAAQTDKADQEEPGSGMLVLSPQITAAYLLSERKNADGSCDRILVQRNIVYLNPEFDGAYREDIPAGSCADYPVKTLAGAYTYLQNPKAGDSQGGGLICIVRPVLIKAGTEVIISSSSCTENGENIVIDQGGGVAFQRYFCPDQETDGFTTDSNKEALFIVENGGEKGGSLTLDGVLLDGYYSRSGAEEAETPLVDIRGSEENPEADGILVLTGGTILTGSRNRNCKKADTIWNGGVLKIAGAVSADGSVRLEKGKFVTVETENREMVPTMELVLDAPCSGCVIADYGSQIPGEEELKKYQLEQDILELYRMEIEKNKIVLRARGVVYVDGADGDDADDGTTPESPLRTLKKAYEKLAEGGGTIYVVNTVTICQTMELFGNACAAEAETVYIRDGTVRILRYSRPDEADSMDGFDVESFTEAMLKVDGGCRLTLGNLVIDGHGKSQILSLENGIRREPEVKAGAAMIRVMNGTLVVTDGVKLQNNRNTSTEDLGGAIRIGSSGIVEMYGGCIEGNRALYRSDGVFDFGTLILSGSLEFGEDQWIWLGSYSLGERQIYRKLYVAGAMTKISAEHPIQIDLAKEEYLHGREISEYEKGLEADAACYEFYDRYRLMQQNQDQPGLTAAADGQVVFLQANYGVEYALEHIQKTDVSPVTVSHGAGLTVEITADERYELPVMISVRVKDSKGLHQLSLITENNSNGDYLYDPETGMIQIREEAITGSVVITAEGIKEPAQINVTVPLYVCMYASGGDGHVTVPDAESYCMINQSNCAVQIMSIQAVHEGWKLKKSKEDLQAGELYLKLGNQVVTAEEADMSKDSFWCIETPGTLYVPIQAEIAGGSVNEDGHEAVCTVTYTVAAAED